MNIFQTIEKGKNILKKKGIKTYNLDSEILMSQVFQKNRTEIILNPNVELSEIEITHFDNLIAQRSKKKTNSLHNWQERVLEI